jgi:hypothetical protein
MNSYECIDFNTILSNQAMGFANKANDLARKAADMRTLASRPDETYFRADRERAAATLDDAAANYRAKATVAAEGYLLVTRRDRLDSEYMRKNQNMINDARKADRLRWESDSNPPHSAAASGV